MSASYPVAGVNSYVSACCYHFCKDRLSDLLDDNVILSHETNGAKIFSAKGKKDVFDIYERNFFNNTTDIVVTSLKINELNKEGVASMKLIVDETKTNYAGTEGKSRWHIEDETEFTFIKKENDVLKIAKIFTRVTSKQIPTSKL
jgi:hypothetical protein